MDFGLAWMDKLVDEPDVMEEDEDNSSDMEENSDMDEDEEEGGEAEAAEEQGHDQALEQLLSCLVEFMDLIKTFLQGEIDSS